MPPSPSDSAWGVGRQQTIRPPSARSLERRPLRAADGSAGTVLAGKLTVGELARRLEDECRIDSIQDPLQRESAIESVGGWLRSEPEAAKAWLAKIGR